MARLRFSPSGEPFVTDSGDLILDCSFDPIADPARLEKRIGRVVGVWRAAFSSAALDPVLWPTPPASAASRARAPIGAVRRSW
jgi:ribose 5-phosphate isomerase